MYKNLIFLDIDGVLNYYEFNKIIRSKFANNGSREEWLVSKICKEKVKLLNELCENSNASIVISSSWRKSHLLSELKELFNKCGATFEIIDKTPSTEEGIRGVEVLKWIKKNVDNYHIYRNYVIIDDESDFLIWQQENFFKCDPEIGLTKNICYRISNFFKGFL